MSLTSRFGVAVLLLAVAAGPSAQTVRMKQVMRAKLDHSQRILEAVVTSNWQLLDRESREMALVTRDPAWTALTMPEYIRHTEAFLRATEELTEAAMESPAMRGALSRRAGARVLSQACYEKRCFAGVLFCQTAPRSDWQRQGDSFSVRDVRNEQNEEVTPRM